MKKLLSVITIAAFILTLLSTSIFSVSAETSILKKIKYTIHDGEVSIYDLQLVYGDVVIPAKIEGYPVTSIAFEACYENNSITSIVIPEGVKSIGASAFENCKKLSKITLPDSLESIGYAAFDGTAYCKKTSSWYDDVLYIGKHLIKVEVYTTGACKIKEGTITIANSAFRNCEDITKITLPKTLKNIGNDAFCNCDMLEIFTVSKESKYLSSENGVLFNKNKTELIIAPNCIGPKYTVPNSVKKIRACAFKTCEELVSVTIPDSVKEIGSDAFYSCCSLKKINIPDSVEKIGSSILFATKYRDTKSNWTGDLLYVGNHLVEATEETSGEITIKKGTITIANNTFSSCNELEKINLPDSIKYIGNAAFSQCTSIKEISLPDSVTVLGGAAFSDCSELKSIKLSNNLTTINSATFKGCNNLESLKLPKGLKRIEASAFKDCYLLKSINIPSTVNFIGEKAFRGCRVLKSITIPEGIKSIEAETFTYCSVLKDVNIPKSVTLIEEKAFDCCSSIKKLTLPKSLKKIGDGAFNLCSGIDKIHYKGTKSDHKKISIGNDNYYITTTPWTYEPEKVTSSKNVTSSNKPIKEETTSSKEIISTETSTSSVESLTESQNNESTQIKTKATQNNAWIIWVYIAAIVIGIFGGFVAFILKKKALSK